jgi:hypothetical protein
MRRNQDPACTGVGTGKEVEGSTDSQFCIILPFKFCPFNANAKTGCSGRGATATTSCPVLAG